MKTEEIISKATFVIDMPNNDTNIMYLREGVDVSDVSTIGVLRFLFRETIIVPLEEWEDLMCDFHANQDDNRKIIFGPQE